MCDFTRKACSASDRSRRRGLRQAGWAAGKMGFPCEHGGSHSEDDIMKQDHPAAAVTIYHNPACGTSRNTLALIRGSGIEPQIVEYLKHPLGRARLVELIAAMGVPVREVLRRKGTSYDELKLDAPQWTDDQLIDFIVAQPILMNRPIVVTPHGARLCRPAESVLEILPRAPR